MVDISASEVKNNIRSIKKDSIVTGRVLRQSTYTLNCSEHKQLALVVSASRALVRVGKPTQCISPPIVLDCAHMRACPSTEQHY